MWNNNFGGNKSGIFNDIVKVEDGYICVSKSSCPHQDCVRMGRVNVSNRPIICVYNAVYIVIAGQSEFDVEV